MDGPKPRQKNRKSRRRLGSRSYKNYSAEMLDLAIQLVKEKSLSSREAERQFCIPRRTIINKIKQIHNKSVGCPIRLNSEDESKIVKVLIACGDFGCPLTKLDVRLTVFDYLKKNGREHLFDGRPPGKAWIEGFLKRHARELTIRSTQNIKQARAEKGIEEFMTYFNNLSVTLKDVPASNILNFDETNLSDDPGTSKCIFRRDVKYPEKIVNSTKGAISLMFSGTADGMILPIYVVYKAENLYSEWIQGGPRGTRFNHTKSGWFDSTVFEDYFKTIILNWATSLPGKKVIICDNLSSHLNVDVIELCSCYNIQFVFIPPNSTHLTQPLDVAFFGPLKKVWRKILLEYKIENPTQTILNKNRFPKLLTSLSEQIQLKNSKNIKSGFKAAGISPFNAREVLKRIPEYQEELASYGIENAFLDYLKKIRQPKPINVKRNKKVITEPGKSVSIEDFTEKQRNKAGISVTGKPSKNNGLNTKKTKNKNIVSKEMSPGPSSVAINVIKNSEVIPKSDDINVNECAMKMILNEKSGLIEMVQNKVKTKELDIMEKTGVTEMKQKDSYEIILNEETGFMEMTENKEITTSMSMNINKNVTKYQGVKTIDPLDEKQSNEPTTANKIKVLSEIIIKPGCKKPNKKDYWRQNQNKIFDLNKLKNSGGTDSDTDTETEISLRNSSGSEVLFGIDAYEDQQYNQYTNIDELLNSDDENLDPLRCEDIKTDSPNKSSDQLLYSNLKENCYGLVKFDTGKSTKYYVGEILKVEKSNITINFLRKKKHNNVFYWPQVEDISVMTILDIVKILSNPPVLDVVC